MLILVAGLPGSGKSFLAEKLALQLSATYLNSDQIRIKSGATGKYTYKDKLVVYQQMCTEASLAIRKEKNVVVDATFFNHTLREIFVKLARTCGTQLHVIEVIAEESLIKKRLAKERKYSQADYLVYEKIRDEFEEITMPHLVLISTDNNIEDMMAAALHYLKT